uniref:HEPN_Cthe2314 domain-containing protein n=1 Tax=Panagrellus redivivus TaxID=6233 RepID=A0A7E4W9B0_PANRE
MARKVHQTELNLLKIPGERRPKRANPSRHELHQRPSTRILRPRRRHGRLSEESKHAKLVFTLLYSNDFNMNDGIDGKLYLILLIFFGAIKLND